MFLLNVIFLFLKVIGNFKLKLDDKIRGISSGTIGTINTIFNNEGEFEVDFSSEKFRWCAKSRYYDAGKIEFAIDDAPKHVAEYAKHGIFCYMPKKNYNKEIRGMAKTSTYPYPKDIFQGCF